MLRSFRNVFASAALIGLTGVTVSSLSSPRVQGAATIQSIFSDQTLWGKDTLLLASKLTSWKRLGDSTLVIYPQSSFGATQYGTPQDAQRASVMLSGFLNGPQPALNANVAAALKVLQKGNAPSTTVKVIPRFKEDDAIRVCWTAADAQFIAPNLAIKDVLTRLGKPESVVRKAVVNQTERRPVGLTLYSYAGGGVVFAESTLPRMQGLVDRVIINLPSVTTAIY